MHYVDLSKNPERYTGYAGKSPQRVWKSIYEENCFKLEIWLKIWKLKKKNNKNFSDRIPNSTRIFWRIPVILVSFRCVIYVCRIPDSLIDFLICENALVWEKTTNYIQSFGEANALCMKHFFPQNFLNSADKSDFFSIEFGLNWFFA